MEKEKNAELIHLDMQYWGLYHWPNGKHIGAFLKELKENAKIYTGKCPNCGRFFCPPLPMCGRCHVKIEEQHKWIEVGPKGTLFNFTVIEQQFLHPQTGQMLEVPFPVGLINLDGAPTSFFHRLEETDSSKLHVGMRVKAIFRPKSERRGDISDIRFFRTVE